MDLKSTFRGKRVLLTGHTGFKGAWLSMILDMLGAETMGYALAPKTSKDLYPQLEPSLRINSVIGDIRDRKKMLACVQEFQPDYVIHMAAQALVLDSYKDPVGTYETNVMGTIYLMDALRTLNKPCTSVLITTDKVYENFEVSKPYPEDARLGGFDPYSNSKACAELAISSYRNSFFPIAKISEHQQAVASARSGNVIGGGDWSENRLVPDIARALLQNKPVTIRNPKAVRPWQHVLDPLNGYLMLAAQLSENPQQHATGYNFGPQPNDERTVEDMVKLSIEKWGSGSFEAPAMGQQPHEAGLLKLDITKAQSALGWSPKFTSEEAVTWTMDWYKQSDGDVVALCQKQISDFFDL